MSGEGEGEGEGEGDVNGQEGDVENDLPSRLLKLEKELQQRDILISSMKDKTRDFVAKIRLEQQAAIQEVEAKADARVEANARQLVQDFHATIGGKDSIIADLEMKLAHSYSLGVQSTADNSINKCNGNESSNNGYSSNINRNSQQEEEMCDLLNKLKERDSQVIEQNSRLSSLIQTLNMKEKELAVITHKYDLQGNEMSQIGEKHAAESKALSDTISILRGENAALLSEQRQNSWGAESHLSSKALELELDNKGLLEKISDSNCLLEAMQGEVRKLEAELQLARSEDSASAISSRVDIDSKARLIEQLRSEVSKYDTSVGELKSTLSLKEKELADMGRRLEQSYSLNKTLEEQNSVYQKQLDEKDKNLKQHTALLQQQHFMKNNEYTNEILTLQESISMKDIEVQKLLTHLSQLQSQIEQLQESNNDWKRQLLNEQSKQNETKSKVKVYVDSILSEKRTLEENVQAVNNSKTLLEQQMKHLEMKICTLQEQILSEQDKVTNAHSEVEKLFRSDLLSKDEVIQCLNDKLKIASQHTVSEVLELKELLNESKSEIESHKNKRIAARNEMISAAKMLECMERENEELKVYLKSTVAPLISQQRSVIDSLMSIVVYSSNTLSKKPSIQKILNDRNGTNSFDISSHSNISSHNVSSHDKGQDVEIEMPMAAAIGGSSFHVSYIGSSNSEEDLSAVHVVNSSYSNMKRSALQDTMLEARTLKRGLESGLVGSRSLSVAAEGLRELVLLDNEVSNRGCCGSILDALCGSGSGSVGGGGASKTLGSPRKGNGYSVINEDSDALTISVVSSPLTNNSSKYSKV